MSLLKGESASDTPDWSDAKTLTGSPSYKDTTDGQGQLYLKRAQSASSFSHLHRSACQHSVHDTIWALSTWRMGCLPRPSLPKSSGSTCTSQASNDAFTRVLWTHVCPRNVTGPGTRGPGQACFKHAGSPKHKLILEPSKDSIPSKFHDHRRNP